MKGEQIYEDKIQMEVDIETKEYVEYILNLLSLREKVIIKMKYGIDYRERNCRQIAKTFRLSKSRIERIINRGIEKLQYRTSISKYSLY